MKYMPAIITLFTWPYVFSSPPEACNSFLYLPHICSVPQEFLDSLTSVRLVETTSSVCRHLCVEVYDMQCSSVLYDFSTRTCFLSAYTGDSVKLEGNKVTDCHNSTMEFFRRKRCSGVDTYKVTKCQAA